MKWNDSCWLINYKNGYRIILSEVEYLKHKSARDVADIESDEHWFLMEKCIERNPNVEIVK